ncbi:hypothetical protein AAG570_007128 [Ranatra chinensis]|uniref:Uncharacterized protein n=1 Tax=Ranatra chinensis TaxID=642074 RepID=A0ABD0XUY6_9HEMI
MVYLHFPPGHTEEELMLQTKYEKLKRKSHAAATAHHAAVQQAAGSAAAKRARCEARDAREIARKLLKSGAIAAIQKTPRREQQAGGFKRPCGLERKLADERAERPLSGYQPFSATQPEDFNNVTTVAGHEPDRLRIKVRLCRVTNSHEFCAKGLGFDRSLDPWASSM